MKTALTLIISILSLQVPVSIYSQNFVWKTPQQVTDSLSNNQNPIISPLDYFDGPGYYVFWERSVDSLSTDIYVKNFYSQDDPLPLIHDGEYHYKNPQIIRPDAYYLYDTIFFLAYESNNSGNNDIYVVRVTPATISSPVMVSNDSMYDTHMRCNFAGSIVWENNGQVFYASLEDKNSPNWYVSDPIVISDSNSYNPVINWKVDWWNGPEYIAWILPSDTNAAIYYSYRDNPDSLLSEPIMLHDSGYNMNLRFSNNFWDMEITLLTWDNEDNGLICPKAFDFWEEDFYSFNLHQSIPFTPSIFPIVIPVDFWDLSFFAISKVYNGATDIYVTPGPWLGEIYNLTETWQAEQNPQLFEGRLQSYYQDFILIWESQRNNNMQLWRSVYTMPMGGLNANNYGMLSVKIAPNPFTTSTTFKYFLEKPTDVAITIYNAQGQVVDRIQLTQDKGEQRVTWNAEGLPSGMYYFRIVAGEMLGSGKLVLD